MSAALSYGYEIEALRGVPTALAIPAELAALFEESTKAKSTYDRLEERDRRGFIRYIELATTPIARERRAAIVATSLLGLAACFVDGAGAVKTAPSAS
ncbi:MAG: hypothetical protein JWP87_700 [Labilithrix sp.]|jgi:uncharacterized protein YdeI (YjbR/CyaY-like superfamily)|nr:hypothetical protein [Labilithrix sp.]